MGIAPKTPNAPGDWSRGVLAVRARAYLRNNSSSRIRVAARGRQAAVAVPTFERISVDPDQMDGLPCIRGMRITVSGRRRDRT